MQTNQTIQTLPAAVDQLMRRTVNPAASADTGVVPTLPRNNPSGGELDGMRSRERSR